ncbi:Chromatin organization modifier domain [Fragilaria crotonensis]|nr:Chromatin organization modifier domain [Fragilaria crotonensis]
MTKRKKSFSRSSSAKRARKSLDNVGTPTSTKGVLVDGGNSRNGNDLYWEMESIVGKRVYKGKVQYKVHWKGCTAEDDTWEPVSNLCDSAYKDALLYDKAAAAERVKTDKTPDTTSPRKKKKVAKKMVHCLMVQGDGKDKVPRPKGKSTVSSVKDNNETIVAVKSILTTESTAEASEVVPVVDGKAETAAANVHAVQDASDPPVKNGAPVPETSPHDGDNPVDASSKETVEGDASNKDVEQKPVVDDAAPLPPAVGEADNAVVGEGQGELVVADDEVPFPVI